MITCNQGKDIPCVMKLVHYLRYYKQKHGSRISRKMAEKAAATEGFIIDLTGIAGTEPEPQYKKDPCLPSESTLASTE